ncbi:MAG TPA: radical SAM protein [Candidatus Nanoarchaeia archaeon]|nr:radical SAM protein [Candidatus Nanoarchaeia archaeon]
MNKSKSALLKLDLLSSGVDFEKSPEGIGTSVKEEYRALFDARLSNKRDLSLPPEIVLEGDIVAKTIYRPNSSYVIKECDGVAKLFFKPDKYVADVKFPQRPSYYGKNTTSGIPMNHVGQLLGLDCLGIILNSYCSRAREKKHCKFCNINSTTNQSHDSVRKIEDIVETASEAHRLGDFSLVNLTGGTFRNPEYELVMYLAVAKKMREIMGLSRLPGVSSINPPNRALLDKYRQNLIDANFDLVTYNLEVWDREILKEVCPGKHELGGRERYIESAQATIDILGRGHVGIIFTVGPWESVNIISEGSRQLAEKGILPIPVVFHPGKGADYSWMGTTNKEDLLKLFRDIYKIYKENDLIPKNRNRPAGSEKSFRNSLINESVLGYLN